MTPLSRLREVIEKTPEMFQGPKNFHGGYRVGVDKNQYRKLQKLALLLPECVEAMDKMNIHVSIEHDEECPARGVFHISVEDCTCHVFAAANTRARIEREIGGMG